MDELHTKINELVSLHGYKNVYEALNTKMELEYKFLSEFFSKNLESPSEVIIEASAPAVAPLQKMLKPRIKKAAPEPVEEGEVKVVHLDKERGGDDKDKKKRRNYIISTKKTG
jgi:hypothetical protein